MPLRLNRAPTRDAPTVRGTIADYYSHTKYTKITESHALRLCVPSGTKTSAVLSRVQRCELLCILCILCEIKEHSVREKLCNQCNLLIKIINENLDKNLNVFLHALR